MRFLATFITNVSLHTKSKILSKIFHKIRAIILQFTDPIIDVSFRGFRLCMPFSHSVFHNQKIYPNFDMQLHKIAGYIKSKQGVLNMIDVGANIGDTAVFTNIKEASYLMIEGEASYAALITKNMAYNYTLSEAGGGSNLTIMSSMLS